MICSKMLSITLYDQTLVNLFKCTVIVNRIIHITHYHIKQVVIII